MRNKIKILFRSIIRAVASQKPFVNFATLVVLQSAKVENDRVCS